MHSLYGYRPTSTDLVSAWRRSLHLNRADALLPPRQLRGRYVAASNYADATISDSASNNVQPMPSHQQQQQQQATPAAAPAPDVSAGVANIPENAEQILKEFSSQQMLLLQQQVTMLTQLLQQSQQQNAVLVSQVQQITQELATIKQTISEVTARKRDAIELPSITADLFFEVYQQCCNSFEMAQHIPNALPGMPTPLGQVAAAGTMAAPATTAAEVGLEEPPPSQPHAAEQRPPVASSAGVGGGMVSSVEGSPLNHEPAYTSKPRSRSNTDTADAAEQQLLQSRPRGDSFSRAVRACSTWQQVRSAVETAAADQQQLEAWQLLVALRQLSGIMNSSSVDYSSGGSSSDAGVLAQPFSTPGDFAAALLQQLLQHPELWSPLAPASGCSCCLYPHEIKTLLVACAGLPLKLPYGSNQHLQTLYEAALQHTPGGIATYQQQAGSTASSAGAAAGEAELQLSVDQQLQLLGACLVLGLTPHQKQLQLLSQLDASVMEQSSLLAAAFTVFTTDALHTNRVLANPAAAARVAGALPPDQVALGEVPLPVFAAALRRVGAAGGRGMNAKLGARRMRQLLLLPLVRLKVHLPLLQNQLQELQQQRASNAAAVDAQFAVHVRSVCEAVQAAIANGLYEQQQQQRGQQRQQQRGQQQQRRRRGPGPTSYSQDPHTGRRHGLHGDRSYALGSSKAGTGSAAAAVATGGWTVVTAAAALLLMSRQLGCLLKPRLLGSIAGAMSVQIESLPDRLLLPVVQLVAASAAASDTEHQQGQHASSNNHGASHRGYAAWQTAVLNHLSSSQGRLTLDQLTAVLLELAQQHTAEAAEADDVAANSSSSTFLSQCDALLARAVLQELAAADADTSCTTARQPDANHKNYSSKQLAQLLPQLAASGLQPSANTATALVHLILLAPHSQPQPGRQLLSGPQHVRSPPALAQQADFAVAYTAAGQLPNPPDQESMQRLAAAAQQDGAATRGPPSAGNGLASEAGAGPAATAHMTAVEACALVCALAGADGTSSSGQQHRSRLGDLTYAVYSGISHLQGSQLAAFVAALAQLGVSLNDLLGPRVLDVKAGISYGMVVAAAASAAAAPAVLDATPPAAVAQLAASVAAVGGRPDDVWWRAVLGRLAGQLSAVGGVQLQQLLQGLLLCGVAPGQGWLDEACKALLLSSSASASSSSSLQALREQSRSDTGRLVTCCSLLVQLGATLPLALQETLLAAVDTGLLQQCADGADSTPPVLQPEALADLLADAGCTLGRSGAQVPRDWLAKYVAVTGQLLLSASGSSCCRLAVAVASMGGVPNAAWIKELQKQLDAKALGATTANICEALCSMRRLGAKPSPLLANALVIKTQEHLQTGSTGMAASAAGTASKHAAGTRHAVLLPGGLLAHDLAGAACAIAAAGLKLPTTWCSAVIKQLAAVADQLQLPSLLQTMYAAVSWHIRPTPKSLLLAAQGKLSDAQDLGQLVPVEHLNVIATALLDAGHAVPQPLLPFLPAGAAAAAANKMDGLSLSERASAAKLTEAAWQAARTALKKSTLMDVESLQEAAVGLRGQSAGAVVGFLKPAERWGQLVQGLALHQQRLQQQQLPDSTALDLRASAVLQQFVQLAAAAVQEVPAAARAVNGGPATLVALRQLQAKLQPAWVAAVTSDVDSTATGKSSWFRQASVQELLAYLQANTAACQQVTAHQLEGLAKYMPSKLQDASVSELLQLLELLPAAVVLQTAVSVTPQQHAQQKRQQQCTETLVQAVLPLLVAAAGTGQLLQQDAKDFIAALARLHSSVLMTPAATGDSTSADSSSKTSRRKSASQGSANQLSIDSVLQLVRVGVGSVDEQHAVDTNRRAAVLFLLGCLQLATTVPAAQRPHQLCEQLLQLFVQTVSQAHEPLHPHMAAQLFLPAVALTVTVNPDIAKGTARPDAQLGGCLVQLLGDVESDLQQLGNAELASLPKIAAMVHLELTKSQQFIQVVVQRQQQLATALPSVVQEAAAAGGGPVQLLNAAVFQVMNKQPAEAGNSTWEGLQDFVGLQDSSSRTDTAAEASSTSTDAPQVLTIPAALFDVTNAAVARVSSNLSSADLCDLMHCYIMAAQTSGGCTWMSRLAAPGAQFNAEELSHNQQQALLVIFAKQLLTQQEPPSPVFVEAVLNASMRSLERWPPALLAYTLHTLGRLVVRYVGDLPDQLTALLLQWQHAAMAALTFRMNLLPAESCVQVLQGCGRLKAALQPEAEQPGTVAPCLHAAALSVVCMLDELQPEQYIRVLHGLGLLGFAGPAMAEDLLDRLEPHLRALSAESLADLGVAYAQWPNIIRPQLSHQWAHAFLTATQQHLAAAMPVSVRSQEQPGAVVQMSTGREVHPGVLLQLARCIPHLPVLPLEDWRSLFMLVAVGQITAFTAAQAAQMLYALAQWKAAMTEQLCNEGASDSEAQAAADTAFAPCIALYDALMFRVASSGGVAPPGMVAHGALQMDTVALLPTALHGLSWPPDQQIVQQMLEHICSYRATLDAQLHTMQEGLQQRRELLEPATEAVNTGISSKKPRRKQLRAAVQLTKQQVARVTEEVRYLEGMIPIGNQQLEQLDSLQQEWEGLLLQAAALSSRVAAVESRGMLPSTAPSTGASSSSSSIKPHANADRLAASSTGLDLDQLMAGMMSAAGMTAAGTAEAGSELDAVFGDIERFAVAWAAEDDNEDEDEQYIDTVSQDL